MTPQIVTQTALVTLCCLLLSTTHHEAYANTKWKQCYLKVGKNVLINQECQVRSESGILAINEMGDVIVHLNTETGYAAYGLASEGGVANAPLGKMRAKGTGCWANSKNVICLK